MAAHRTVRAFLEALPPVIASVGWVVATIIAVRIVPEMLSTHLRVAEFVTFGIAVMGGIGGLVGFWYSASSLEFLVRGYQVRCRDDASWVYEERRPDGSVAMLPIRYVPLANEYRPPCQLHLPSAECWDSVVPAWARGRREEIVKNISHDLGAEFGRSVQFVDLPDAEAR
jgi:hypothetical protein